MKISREFAKEIKEKHLKLKAEIYLSKFRDWRIYTQDNYFLFYLNPLMFSEWELK